MQAHFPYFIQLFIIFLLSTAHFSVGNIKMLDGFSNLYLFMLIFLIENVRINVVLRLLEKRSAAFEKYIGSDVTIITDLRLIKSASQHHKTYTHQKPSHQNNIIHNNSSYLQVCYIAHRASQISTERHRIFIFQSVNHPPHSIKAIAV